MDDRQLIADLLSALEYHTEQTRPIEFSKVAIQAAREYLRKPVQQLNAGVPPLYPEPERGVSIKAEYEPAQPMHPEIKKMYEDYFDKCFRESSEPVAWAVQACSKMWRGEFAEIDAKAEAKRIGGTCVAFALYTELPQRPWVGLTDGDWEWVADKKETSLDTFAHGAAWAADQLKERNNG